MSGSVKKCTGKQGIDSLHDWVLRDKLNKKTTLKSGKIKHTHHLLCSTCECQMIETLWVVNDKIVNSRLQWKGVVRKVAS